LFTLNDNQGDMMSYTRLRQFILLGWAITLICIVAGYIYALFEPVAPDITVLMTSMGAVIGLLAPHLTIVYEFLLLNQSPSDRRLNAATAYTMLSMCALYWILLIVAVWAGVVYRAFSTAPDGEGIELSTSIVIAIAGSLSFLAVKPTIKLFVIKDSDEPSARKDASERIPHN
jgi:hypothetical protein